MGFYQQGEWSFRVNPLRTKKFYAKYQPEDLEDTGSQTYRNYAKFCETLTQDERDFFEQFGIDVLKTELMTTGLNDEGFYVTRGTFYYSGRCIQEPAAFSLPHEERMKLVLKDEDPDPNIYAGRFTMSPCDFDDSDVFLEIPSGFSKFVFALHEMPWLLDEECERHEQYPEDYVDCDVEPGDYFRTISIPDEETPEDVGLIPSEEAGIYLSLDDHSKWKARELQDFGFDCGQDGGFCKLPLPGFDELVEIVLHARSQDDVFGAGHVLLEDYPEETLKRIQELLAKEVVTKQDMRFFFALLLPGEKNRSSTEGKTEEEIAADCQMWRSISEQVDRLVDLV